MICLIQRMVELNDGIIQNVGLRDSGTFSKRCGVYIENGAIF